MNEITEFLKNRRSVLIKNLNAAPIDTADIGEILECGLRVPDHGVLGPWRIRVITPETGAHLGQHILAPEFAAKHADATEAILTFERHRFTRTGAVLAVISTPMEHSKIPAWEMHLSAGALCINLLHGALALSYGAQWVTEWYAHNDRLLTELGGNPETDKFAGFIYIGHKIEEPKPRRRPEKKDIISVYKPTQ